MNLGASSFSNLFWSFALLFLTHCKPNSLVLPDNVSPPKVASNFLLFKRDGTFFDFYRENRSVKISILFFGYSHCPDVCLSVLEKFSQIISKLNSDDLHRVSFIFISIDPKEDSLDQLNRFMNHHNPKIIALTGTNEETTKIKKNYNIFTQENQNFGKNLSEGKIIHSTNIFWINNKFQITKSLTHHFNSSDLLKEIQFSLNNL